MIIEGDREMNTLNSVLIESETNKINVEKKTRKARVQQRYGSGINHFLSQDPSFKPTVGMGATLLMWSDRVAYTVVEISKNWKQLKAIKDISHRVDNRCERGSQE